jgi:hypothetical protein
MRRGPVTETLSLFSCLNHLISTPLSSLLSGIRNRITVDPFCSNTLIILVPFLFFFYFFGLYNLRDQISVTSQLCFFVCRMALTFLSTLKTFLLFVTVAMLSRCQSPVNFRYKNARGRLQAQNNYR